jgi:hypothetical protein
MSISKEEKELFKSVQQHNNIKTLRTFLDEQDENIDLVLTQLVINMHQHFKVISPDDRGLDYSFNVLLEMLNCIFYGDPKAKNELEYTIPEEYDLTKEDVLIKYFRLVMVIGKLRHHTRQVI